MAVCWLSTSRAKRSANGSANLGLIELLGKRIGHGAEVKGVEFLDGRLVHVLMLDRADPQW